MNLYATLDDVKDVLNESGTDRDTRIMVHLEDASRRIDEHCKRVFWTETGTRYFDGRCGVRLYLDDFLAVSALATDSERDNSFDGETWVDGTDFVVWPDNSWPKLGVYALPDGNYAFSDLDRYIKATGTWGYGDGKSASPWGSITPTGTVATTTGTTLTLSAAGVVKPGHTLKIGTEQLYVSAVSTGVATVERGVNGTTAAAHSTAAITVAQYPALVTRTAVTLAIGLFSRSAKAGMKSERIGDYQYTLATEEDEAEFLGRSLSGFVRMVV